MLHADSGTAVWESNFRAKRVHLMFTGARVFNINSKKQQELSSPIEMKCCTMSHLDLVNPSHHHGYISGILNRQVYDRNNMSGAAVHSSS